MKVKEKFFKDLDELMQNGPVTIVAFGDSVTHGAFDEGEIDYECVYHNRLRKKMNETRAYMPVNVINAGIGGITATQSLDRLDSQVLAHNPDLVIVCFGLNDVNGELADYLNSLKTIFTKIQESGAELIFMTPNMMNTRVDEDTALHLVEYATHIAQVQNGGKMDLFMESAVKVAEELGVTVCDCYKEWKKLSESQDVTKLLANRINHPLREMHELFASKLYEIIFE
ncbi:MAG: GDSL family lipase [Clostridia bacterium]|nr:GDSL family lipase [Clostridia bacterium]